MLTNDYLSEETGNGTTVTTPSPGVNNKLQSIKNWTISTYKCSRQSLYERLGKTNKTVDLELEGQIEKLRDTREKYSNILRLSRALASHFYHVVTTQSSLGDCFSDLAHKSPELQEEFLCNAETQKNLTRSGQQLLAALNFFVSSINTIVNKTMEDTMVTVKHYEVARVEYDAYRTDLEYYKETAAKSPASAAKVGEVEQSFDLKRNEFEKLRSDVQIKLKFLDENRVKVMQKQLLLFHNAVGAYFSGNQTALESIMKQFSIKVTDLPQSSLDLTRHVSGEVSGQSAASLGSAVEHFIKYYYICFLFLCYCFMACISIILLIPTECYSSKSPYQ